MTGYIHSIESMGLVDGPGVRSVVFMQGCLLRCKYCHNPDTWKNSDYNHSLTPQELAEKLIRFKEYFGDKGGITFSGGEPLLQIDFLIEVIEILKKENIHVAIDTAGVGNVKDKNYVEKLKKLLSITDLVLLDIKHYNKKKYKEITNHNIDDFNLFLSVLQDTNVPIWIRHVVVPNLTDGLAHIKKLKQYIAKLNNIEKIELLAYHTMGVDKYKKLKINYPLTDTKIPHEIEMQKYQQIMNKEV